MREGYLAAIAWSFIVAFFNVMMMFVGEFNVHPILFVGQGMLFASFAMLVMAGPGLLAKETMRSLSTWTYGVTFLLSTACFLAAMTYISAADMSLLGRFSIVFSSLIGFVFMKRARMEKGMLAFIGLFGTLIWVAYFVPPDVRKPVYTLIFFFSLFQALQAVVSETHKTNNLATSISQRLRVTAFIMTATSVTFIVFLAASSFAQSTLNVNTYGFAPTFEQFVNVPSFLFAAFYGLFGLGAIRYFEFISTKIIKSENFLAITAISPLLTFAFQYTGSVMGLVAAPSLSIAYIAALFLVIVFSILFVYFNHVPTLDEQAQKDMNVHKEALKKQRAAFLENLGAEGQVGQEQSTKDAEEGEPQIVDYNNKFSHLPHFELCLYNDPEDHLIKLYDIIACNVNKINPDRGTVMMFSKKFLHPRDAYESVIDLAGHWGVELVMVRDDLK
jgi:hypothetical protein